MDYKKLGLALVFTVLAILNFLKNPLPIFGNWLNLVISLAAIFNFFGAFKIELSLKLFKKVWRGEFDFKRTFWVFYVLIGSILSIPNFLMEIYYDSMGEILALLALVYVLAYFAYIFYAMIGTWRAATKYNQLKKKKKDPAFWGYAAKTYLVLTGLNVLREIISPFIN